MFLRAQLSSQLSSLTDFLTTIVLAKFLGMYYVHATFLGAVCGGITNCVVNYRWTFKAGGVKKKYVIIKYFIVWSGSIFLNTGGTWLMTEMLRKIHWLTALLGHAFNDVFLVSKIIISLIVGLGWNYNMQRLFVYRERNIRQLFRRKKATKKPNADTKRK
jgi:putative flippase GtrA